MPFKSDNQRKAMFAASEGKSKIGIPEGVADKFLSDAAVPSTPQVPSAVMPSPTPQVGSMQNRGGAPSLEKEVTKKFKRKALAGVKPRKLVP